jgi:holo-[acyl-carrier protein] synthase
VDVVGIGVDIIELSRIRGALERYGDRFQRRVFAASELVDAREWRDPVPFLAGRFAAKEAVLKALGSGLAGGIEWTDVVLVRGARGAPTVRLEGAARERAAAIGAVQLLVSLSHARDYAVAQALALGGGGSRPFAAAASSGDDR